MLPLEAKEQETEQKSDWIRRTSQKILAVGAGLVAFLKYTDRIFISPEPCHVHIPVKSHTESGPCRTVMGGKSAVVGIVP